MRGFNKSRGSEKMGKILIILGVSFVVAVGTIVVWGTGVFNRAISLENKAEAQQENLEVVHDQMWKTLQQKAGITSQYKDAFAEIYPALMSGRYSEGGGSLMKWVQEKNPDFDTSLYKDLMDSVEGLRAKFATEQKLLLDIAREHKNLRQQIPSSIIAGGRPEIEVKLVTSTRSKAAVESGVDDDVNLF